MNVTAKKDSPAISVKTVSICPYVSTYIGIIVARRTLKTFNKEKNTIFTKCDVIIFRNIDYIFLDISISYWAKEA